MWGWVHPAAAVAAFLVATAATASEQAASGEDSPRRDINKKLTNPVSDLWSITFHQNNFCVDVSPSIGERWNSNLNSSAKWIADLFVQQWFSFAGSDSRSGVSR